MSIQQSPSQRIKAMATFSFIGACIAYTIYLQADVDLPPIYPILFVLIIAAISGAAGPALSTSTWAPGQSPRVKEICQHLTPEEHHALLQQSKEYGVKVGGWIGIAAIVTFWVTIYTGNPQVLWAFPLSQIPIAFHARHHRRTNAKLLLSTTWARAQGYTPETLRIRNFTEPDSPKP